MPGLYEDNLVEALRTGVQSILGQWGLPADTDLHLLCISENATFRADVSANAAPLVFRVHRPGYHQRDEILSELAWIDALRAEGVVTTPRPLQTRAGEPIGAFDHDGEPRHVVAFEFMPGVEPEETGDLRAGFRQLGSITARLHRHARRWQKPPAFNRKTWDFETTLGSRPHWGDWRAALGLEATGKAVLAECVTLLAHQLEDYGAQESRFGLIHADLRLANLLLDEERLAVIDFDDCGFSWFMYDFAAAVSFIETSPQLPALQQAWVQGYREVEALDAADEQAISMFVMLRRLLLTAWIASHAETPTAQALGSDYTVDSVRLARAYLRERG